MKPESGTENSAAKAPADLNSDFNLLAFMQVETPPRLTFNPQSFETIAPDLAKTLKEKGVQDITVTPGSPHKLEAKLANPIDIPADKAAGDEHDKLTVEKNLSANIQKAADGTITITDIQGFSAKASFLGSEVVLPITKIELRKNAQGQTEITSYAQGTFRERKSVKVEPGETYNRAEGLLQEINKQQNKPAENKKAMYRRPDQTEIYF